MRALIQHVVDEERRHLMWHRSQLCLTMVKCPSWGSRTFKLQAGRTALTADELFCDPFSRRILCSSQPQEGPIRFAPTKSSTTAVSFTFQPKDPLISCVSNFNGSLPYLPKRESFYARCKIRKGAYSSEQGRASLRQSRAQDKTPIIAVSKCHDFAAAAVNGRIFPALLLAAKLW